MQRSEIRRMNAIKNSAPAALTDVNSNCPPPSAERATSSDLDWQRICLFYLFCSGFCQIGGALEEGTRFHDVQHGLT